ncbi:MAG: hypothetical protein PHH47_04095 [Gallionella sp.]|nr:hypothetical protein [Gallionella sp.]MDD4945576.1 hypothetical protein [Gallionella sp.]MDD5612092.1 hypothetical protein [Gallionella sp.]
MISLLQATYKELGLSGTLVHSFNQLMGALRIRQVAIRKYHITRQAVTLSEAAAGKGQSIEVRELYRDDPLCLQLGRPAEVIQARFDQGGHCYAAFRKGQLAGYLWLNFGKYQEDEVRCTFVLSPFDKSAWDYDVYVFPPHRLSYTFPRLWEHANGVMAARGVAASYSRIAYYNTASLGSHSKLGSRVIGSIYFLCVFGMQLSWTGDFRPTFTFTADSRHFPEIHIA